METYLPIQLPSKCIPYPDVSPDSVVVRPYNGEDEILLAQINPVNLERNFLAVMNRVVQGIDPKLLTLGDRLYIIIWEFINSYSDTLSVSMSCSHCLKDVEFPVDLQRIKVKYLPDDYQQPYRVVLPVSKKEIGLRLLNVGDQVEIDQFSQKTPNAYLYRWARSVCDVDSMALMQEMRSWSLKDIGRIRKFHQDMSHGPEMTVEMPCPECGKMEEVVVPFRFDFLYPTGATLDQCFRT